VLYRKLSRRMVSATPTTPEVMLKLSIEFSAWRKVV
jgi:hypothetical protein